LSITMSSVRSPNDAKNKVQLQSPLLVFWGHSSTAFVGGDSHVRARAPGYGYKVRLSGACSKAVSGALP
jgi:hypothetical protein